MGLVATIDYFFITSPYKLYYFGDNTSYELSAALYHFFVYPCSSAVFLFIYDKWKLYGRKTAWYIFIWTCFSLFLWLNVINHTLTYTGWKLYYSIPVYPIAAVMLIIVYRISKKKLHELSLLRLYMHRRGEK
ncbi:hypothetical protein [Paenibacillus aestuarii]|uniref:Uncharacterized protein n=1 Tax=Paenibacillus aestuarii TaxID=516965 RepID=A0ABW0KB36_9BACL|nr:hypothetical protein [Paenibacillus aestuarii]